MKYVGPVDTLHMKIDFKLKKFEKFLKEDLITIYVCMIGLAIGFLGVLWQWQRKRKYGN